MNFILISNEWFVRVKKTEREGKSRLRSIQGKISDASDEQKLRLLSKNRNTDGEADVRTGVFLPLSP